MWTSIFFFLTFLPNLAQPILRKDKEFPYLNPFKKTSIVHGEDTKVIHVLISRTHLKSTPILLEWMGGATDRECYFSALPKLSYTDILLFCRPLFNSEANTTSERPFPHYATLTSQLASFERTHKLNFNRDHQIQRERTDKFINFKLPNWAISTCQTEENGAHGPRDQTQNLLGWWGNIHHKPKKQYVQSVICTYLVEAAKMTESNCLFSGSSKDDRIKSLPKKDRPENCHKIAPWQGLTRPSYRACDRGRSISLCLLSARQCRKNFLGRTSPSFPSKYGHFIEKWLKLVRYFSLYPVLAQVWPVLALPDQDHHHHTNDDHVV